jgi:hypothetical protein
MPPAAGTGTGTGVTDHAREGIGISEREHHGRGPVLQRPRDHVGIAQEMKPIPHGFVVRSITRSTSRCSDSQSFPGAASHQP